MAEIVLNIVAKLHKDKSQNIQDVFEAADFDESGSLDFDEVQTLV